MIRITDQDALHQYDEDGRAITTWDGKKCNWIVNKEFENEDIDWWGEDNDFARGITLAEFEAHNPNWDKNPDIVVTWYWNTKEKAIKAFGEPRSFGERADYWDKQKYPMTAVRDWGYINEPKETAAERFGKYCDWNKFADRVVVTYNRETIFDGVLK